MIEAIFFDIDGTLLSHKQGGVPKSAREALDTLKEQGILRVVASGRHMIELKNLPLDGIDFDAYVALNGQLCCDKHGQMFFSNPLTDIDPILELFSERRYPTLLIEKDRSYINFVNNDVRRAVKEISTPVPQVGDYDGAEILQAIVFVDKIEQKSALQDLTHFSVTRWNDRAVDVVSLGASKVQGIKKFLEKAQLDAKDCAAFGDGENDIEMLKHVGHGIALGNAVPELKEVADFVSEDIDSDGVAYGLKHLGLI